ncbi:DUF4238 domain-containing protein [Octadecabacter antarcticus]|uniref:DUF4238 domain-containing protein n=1 Tax=Octadecabacter antarcticus TaxID=1217908 RepID=UPI000A03366A
MGTAAKHHYVPKAILRNFRVRGDSVFYASRKNSMPEPRNIDSIFRRIRYNSFQKKMVHMTIPLNVSLRKS